MARRSALVVLLLMVAVAVAGLPTAHADGDDTAACDDSVNALVSNCKEYVMGFSPPLPSNPGPCCDAVQSAPLDCVCNRVPSYIADMINQEAVKDVVHTCGVQVPAGTTCGGVQWGN